MSPACEKGTGQEKQKNAKDAISRSVESLWSLEVPGSQAVRSDGPHLFSMESRRRRRSCVECTRSHPLVELSQKVDGRRSHGNMSDMKLDIRNVEVFRTVFVCMCIHIYTDSYIYIYIVERARAMTQPNRSVENFSKPLTK